MYKIKKTGKFKKDYKKFKFDNEVIFELKKVLNILVIGDILPKKYKNHILKGGYNGIKEYHIKSDILLIYKIENNELELLLLRLGSHSELF